MNPATFLLLTVSSVLILRSGERLEVNGPIHQRDGQFVFRAAGGGLYSIARSEVDEKATAAAADAVEAEKGGLPKKLKLSAEERDRLLAELSLNRNGKPPLPQKTLTARPPVPTPAEVRADSREEWRWRQEARAHEEALRRSREELQLLYDRVRQLEFEIAGFLSLGYRPRDFTYQTTMLFQIREQIPVAELAVAQAQRVYEQFRDDARRQGILPGWLR